MSELKLSDEALKTEVKALPGWKIAGKGDARMLVRELKFSGFPASMKFVNRLADAAEKAGHHPDIDIRYSRVRLGLITHDANGITRKDLDLARVAEALVAADLENGILG